MLRDDYDNFNCDSDDDDSEMPPDLVLPKMIFHEFRNYDRDSSMADSMVEYGFDPNSSINNSSNPDSVDHYSSIPDSLDSNSCKPDSSDNNLSKPDSSLGHSNRLRNDSLRPANDPHVSQRRSKVCVDDINI